MLHFLHRTGIGTAMRTFIVLLALLVAFPTRATEQAAIRPVTGQVAIYDVYASGVHVLEARLDLNEAPGRYDLLFTAHTRGFLSALLPWTGQYEAKGWALGGTDYRPETFKSKTVWKDEIDGKEYRYTKDGGFQELFLTKEGKTEKAEIDPKLAKNTIDDYTSALKVFARIAAEGKCEGEDAIFDEKRRYKQVFNRLENETISLTDYNVFNGEAVACTIEVIPDGGRWHKKPRGWMNVQEQGRRLGQLPKMWAAKMDEKGPAIPVKVLIKTDYGALVIHLAEYRNGDKILVSKKREDK
jgi:hypothetical protein